MEPDHEEQKPNEYLPPPPGQYAPHEQFEETVKPQDQDGLEVDTQMHRKKRQARMFLVATGFFGVLFVIGLIIVITTVGSRVSDTVSSSNDSTNQNLTTEEQLKADVNALGLAIINYNNGNPPFEISPQAVSELRVSYLAKEFSDPRTDETYTLVTSIPEVGELQYIVGGICNTDDSISQSGDNTSFAIRVLLEEDNKLHCLESSEVQQPN